MAQTKVFPCNYAELLGSAFDLDADELLQRWGFTPRGKRCQQCQTPVSKTNVSGYCRQCRWERAHILLTCEMCGTQFRRDTSQIIMQMGRLGQNHIFCGRSCTGRWLGINRGFGVHPENTGGLKKYDHERIWALHQAGERGVDIARAMGMPPQAVYSVLRELKGRH